MSWSLGLLDAKGKSSVQQDGRCVSQYTRTYLLIGVGEFVFATESAVASIVGIARGAPLSDDPNAICYDLDVSIPQPTRIGAGVQVRHVTYLFSTDATLPQQDDDDPTTRRTLWKGGPTIVTTYLTEDKNGKPILDSAGQPFDGGVPCDVRLATFTASRNIDAAGYDQFGVPLLSGRVNANAYLGFPAGTLQVDITNEEFQQGAFHFWAETYTFNYNPLGWQPRPLNAGFYCRDEIDGPARRIKNSDVGDTDADTQDQECPEPQPLDADGLIVPVANRPDDCLFVDVEKFETYDFALFNL